jgi:predicted ArsR family transcriptional regulator
MTNHEKILLDLGIGQSTADSIAGRMRLPEEAVKILLDQLIELKEIEAFQLGTIDRCVYRLTSGSTKLKPSSP